MKLHRLALAAVGPFATEFELDLDRVSASGLFLLEGPTGAGKSTLLDAVTFALYGGVAGRSASKERLHSDIGGDTEPFVELEFSLAGVRHRIRRTPTHERRKRNGSGTTTVQSSVRLWRSQQGEELLLSNRVREADDEVRRLLGGLSLEQFCQVVVLPQGEFATFLRADAEQRRDVLQRLFSTDHYQAIERVSADLRVAANVRIGNADQLVRDAVVALRQVAGEESFEVDSLLDLTDDARATRLDLTEDILREELLGLAATERSTDSDRQQARQSLEALQDLKRRAERRRELERDRELLLARSAEIEQYALDLDAANRALVLVPLIDEHDLARAEVDSVLARLAELPVESGQLAELGLRERATEARSQAAQLEAAVRAESAQTERRVQVAEESKVLGELVAQRISRAARVELAPESIAQLRFDRDRIRILSAREPDIRLRRDAAVDRLAAWSTLNELEDDVELCSDKLRLAIDVAQDARGAHQDALHTHLAGMAAELAAQLGDGDPCAVCGSTVHPALAQGAVGRVDEASLAEFAASVDVAAQLRHVADATLAAARSTLATRQVQAGDKDPSAEVASLSEALDEALAAQSSLSRHELAVVQAEADFDSDRTELARLEVASAAAHDLVQRLTRECDDHDQLVSASRGGYISVADRQSALFEQADSLDERAVVLGRAQAARERLQRAQSVLDLAVHTGGFSSAEAATAARLDDASRTELQRALDENRAAWAVVNSGLSSAEIASALSEIPDLTVASDALVLAETRYEAARAQATALRSRIRDVHAAREHLLAAQDATAKIRDEVRAVVRVADAVTGLGRVNPRRMTLSTYVLRERFESVVAAASHRLERMSSGQFSLERDEATTGAKKAGLGLVVLDQWSGTRRDTRTLSGGESFYASLALALGLADVVRDEVGGVELETLFIDEGFGSLDSESLERVLDVIDSLRDGGRVVGIVSHVTELKDRIPDRIEVRKLVTGGSAASVCA
ncbi:MAG: SMC family ATPase [Actinomycetes bacterium]